MNRAVIIIANPIAGAGLAARVRGRLEEDLRRAGFEPKYVETRARGDAEAEAARAGLPARGLSAVPATAQAGAYLRQAQRGRQAQAGGAAAVVVIGGDGTVNEVLNGLPLPGGPPLAVVPAGTANVLAKELGIPRAVAGVERFAEAVARILSTDARRPERTLRPARTDAERVSWIAPALAAGRMKKIDVGVLRSHPRTPARGRGNLPRPREPESRGGSPLPPELPYPPGRRFALMAGAGYDALIVRILAEERRGAIRMHQYAGWGLKALLRHLPPRIRVAVDGRAVADDASFVIAASSASYGGPVTLTPAALPDDGLFDVAIFRGRGIDDLVRWIAAAWLGRADRDGLCRIVRGREIRLESDDAVDVQVDGDPAGTLPATLTIMEKALTVLVP